MPIVAVAIATAGGRVGEGGGACCKARVVAKGHRKEIYRQKWRALNRADLFLSRGEGGVGSGLECFKNERNPFSPVEVPNARSLCSCPNGAVHKLGDQRRHVPVLNGQHPRVGFKAHCTTQHAYNAMYALIRPIFTHFLRI